MTWIAKLTREPKSPAEWTMLNVCLARRTSFIALRWSSSDLPLVVCRSQDGFYLGSLNSQGMAVGRDSDEYYPDRKTAEAAWKDRTWTQRLDP